MKAESKPSEQRIKEKGPFWKESGTVHQSKEGQSRIMLPSVAAAIVPLIVSLFLFAGCNEKPPEPLGPSIYQIDTVWTDQNGSEMRLKDLEGKPVLLSMIYTRCKMICPRMATDMQRINESLSDSQKENLHLVAVSIDPTNDTPDVLKEFQKKMKLEGNWHLLNGTETEARLLAAAIGFQFRQTPDGHFTHSTTLLMLNEKGEPVHRKDRLNTSIEAITAVAQQLTN
ncbi:MAG: SCO family protein [Leptospiraceae bacterium]